MSEPSDNQIQTELQSDFIVTETECRASSSRSRVPRSTRIFGQNMSQSSNSLTASEESSSQHQIVACTLDRSNTQSTEIVAEFTGEQSGPSSGHVEESVSETSMTSDMEAHAIANRQANLRKQILEIQRNDSIPANEKAKMIQDLMTRNWNAKQKEEKKKDTRVMNFLSNKIHDFSLVTDEDRAKTFHSSGVLGCKHYQRACKLQAHCCGKWDTCRFCHDEVSDHTITRNLVKTMMCMYCTYVQPTGAVCVNPECGKVVAAYYCKECKLWDNDPRKNIYHCYDCGICRIGKGLGVDYFHCPTCNVCMAIGLKGKHKCIERNLESDCPICGEYMFTSTSTVIFMPCGHCMHHKCHQQHIHTSYQCPTCLKSLADMTEYFRRIDLALAEHRMPAEYSNTFSYIYCNDCEKRSYAKFHFIYHKCGYCNGYNSKLLNTRIGLPPDAVIAPEFVITPPTQAADAQRPDTLTRLVSSSSLLSSQTDSSVDSADYVEIWCHQCQGPTELIQERGNERCHICFSDFVERLDH